MFQTTGSKINERHSVIQEASCGSFGIFCVVLSSPHLYSASAFICDLQNSLTTTTFSIPRNSLSFRTLLKINLWSDYRTFIWPTIFKFLARASKISFVVIQLQLFWRHYNKAHEKLILQTFHKEQFLESRINCMKTVRGLDFATTSRQSFIVIDVLFCLYPET
jgi:hypothetical protein